MPPRGAAERLVGRAYDADEPARTEAEEMSSFYWLAHRMAALSAVVLREFRGLGAYATAIDQQGALSADGAAASVQTLSSARSILDEEPALVAADPIFVRGARTTLMQAQRAIRVAATYRYGSDDAQAPPPRRGRCIPSTRRGAGIRQRAGGGPPDRGSHAGQRAWRALSHWRARSNAAGAPGSAATPLAQVGC